MLFENNYYIFLFEEYLREKRNLSESSIYRYRLIVERFLIEHSDILSVDEYNKFIINHAIKKRSVYAYSVLKAFIDCVAPDANTRARLKENLIVPENPKNIKHERKYLDEKELVEVINQMKSTRNKVIALIQHMTGVRAGDVLRIPRGNIIPEIYEGNNVLKLVIEGKGEKRNVIYVHDDLAQQIIIDYVIHNVNNTGYYFIEDKSRSSDSSFYTRRLFDTNYQRYNRDLKEALYKCGHDINDFSTHDYRRCYARRVWTRYKDISVLQKLLHHSNPATTMRYLNQSGLQNIDYHKEMQTE